MIGASIDDRAPSASLVHERREAREGSNPASTDPARMSRDGNASNGWNQNVGGTNAGNQNNNNKNNTNKRVRPVRRSTVPVTEPTTKEVLQGYLDCRRRKRGKDTTTLYEADLSRNIVSTVAALRDGSWAPGSSMCFVVTHPKPREVWAATFADRVVHHVIYNRLRPRMEPRFVKTSFACIPQRGTLAGAEWAHRSMRRVTNGWSKPAWALQMDVANFFPSIDRHLLWSLFAPHCHEPWLAQAMYRVVHHDVLADAHFPGDRQKLGLVEPRKSLWHAPSGKGLPIGNLTSQFAANVYLDEADQFIQHVIRPRFYGRYVDDLVLMDPDKDRLIQARDQITQFMRDELMLTMHGGKTRLQPVDHGLDFVGWRLLPHRRYVRRRTANTAMWNIAHLEDAEDILATANSYLGLAKHGDTWNLRGKWAALAAQHQQIVAHPNRTKVMLRKEQPCRTTPE